MTPLTPQRAAFEKNRGPYTIAIVDLKGFHCKSGGIYIAVGGRGKAGAAAESIAKIIAAGKAAGFRDLTDGKFCVQQ